MKRLMTLTLVGTLGAVAIVAASNVAGDWLIGPWKYGADGTVSEICADFGVAFLYLGFFLTLPVRLLAFGSDSSFIRLVAAIVGFGLWGAAFAGIYQRIALRRTGAVPIDPRAAP